MGETYQYPPPGPSGACQDGSVAVRTTDESDGSGAFAVGNSLTVEVMDVRTCQPLLLGGYVKSCSITVDGDTETYACSDADRYPPAKRTVAAYEGFSSAKKRQKKRFYHFVQSALKRLGWWAEAINGAYSAALGEAMVEFYQQKTGVCPESVNDTLADIDVHLQNALGGRDWLDDSGCLQIGLPSVSSAQTAVVRLEFQDFKVLTMWDVQDATDAAFGQGAGGPVTGMIPRGLPGTAVVYDRAKATWPSGTDDPDAPANESTSARSNWCLQVGTVGGGTARVNFRNFCEFEIALDPSALVDHQETVYALTWCQPVWHEEASFRRFGFERTAENFTGPPETNGWTAINSAWGGSAENYAVFGLFRTRNINGKNYFRLHTGLDVTGRSREEGGELRTPVFAVNGGRATRYGNNLRVNHRDEAVTRFIHMYSADHLAGSNQWVKAGSLLGRMGRNAIPAQYPTHVHFETLIDNTTGWGMKDGSELADGEQKIRDAQYPVNPGVWTCAHTPKHIKAQYGAYARSPGASFEAWMEQQLGAGAYQLYRWTMPASWPCNQTPPCRCEFGSGHTNNPGACTCSCRAEGEDGEELVAAQVTWATTCWAVRVSKDPSACVCPGLVAGGLEGCFTRGQQIQYHLWQLDHYTTGFDGKIGSGTRGILEAQLSSLAADYQAATGQASQWQAAVLARAAEVAAEAEETSTHRKQAIKDLLEESANLDLLLSELRAVAPYT